VSREAAAEILSQNLSVVTDSLS